MNEIGDRIKESRIKANLTQYELAEKIGVAVSTVSMYEKNERIPSDAVKIRIADIFGTTVGSLFFAEKDT